MTIKKTTPYACQVWHKEDMWEKIKKVTYQKNKVTYCVDSNYDILYAEMPFDTAYSIAIKNRAYFEYDKISNKDLRYMSKVLYMKATDMLQSHDYKYSNESARNIYDDIEKCMKIHNFIEPTINFATLTTIENIIKKVNNHIARNGFVALDMEVMVRKELLNEYYELNDEMQEKIKHIVYKEPYTYWELDNIIKQISEMDR